MNEAANTPAERSKRIKWVLAALLSLLAGAVTLLLWFGGATIGDSDPQFRGKPESEWIKNLKYSDDEQVKEWRTYGEEGVQVLIRYIDHAQPPLRERTYRQIYRTTPRFIAAKLPGPKPDATDYGRQKVMALFAGLGADAKSATPSVLKTLAHDANTKSKALAIEFFISSQADRFEKCWVDQLPPEQKTALLHLLINSLKNESSEVRYMAATALRFFSEQMQLITNALMDALQDPAGYAQVQIADTLNQMNPEAAHKANVVATVAPLLRHPDWSVALAAAKLLGKCPLDSEAAIAALQAGLISTNGFVVYESVWSSLQYPIRQKQVIANLELVASENETVLRALRSSKRRLRFTKKIE